MRLDRIAERSFGLLGRILDESIALKNGEDMRRAFVYRHARNIYQLGRDVIFLLESSRLDSCPVVVRAMLESLFKLVAAVKQPEAAVQIVISEVEDDLARITKWLDPVDCAPAIRGFTEFAQHLRSENRITSHKKWTTLACAEAAELGEQYRCEYFHFSGHAHATTGGIILQEACFGVGQVLQTTLAVVLSAAGHAVQIVPTKSPQKHIDESAKLLGKVNGLIENGEFRELDRVNEREDANNQPES
jgi:hypothetical protein